MKLCDLQTSAGRLMLETKLLREAWQQTREVWQDATAQEFEEKYLLSLKPNLSITMAALHELADVIDEAEAAIGENRH